MASQEIDLKTFHDVKEYLQTNSATLVEPPRPGAFTLFSFPPAPKQKYNEVYTRIYLGEKSVAVDLQKLKSLGVTHVVNASQGTKLNQTNTNADFYSEAGISFHGVPAFDIITFKILPHLRPAAEFIHQAMQADGTIFVHCQQGISRSATVVLSYLMLYRDMSLVTAVKTVRPKREIYPNDGFLKQLCILEKEIATAAVS